MLFRVFLVLSLFGVAVAGQSLKKLIVLGETGAGKSHLCNVVTGTTAFLVGHSILVSCTSEPQSAYGNLFGNQTKGVVRMIDTGGLGDTEGRDDAFLDDIAVQIRAQSGVHGLVYVHNACEARLHRQARNSFKAMIATFSNDRQRYLLEGRLSVVFTRCTEHIKRGAWEHAISKTLCEDLGVCKINYFWYDDFEKESSGDGLASSVPTDAPVSFSNLAFALMDSAARVLLEQSNSAAWRDEFVKWVENLPSEAVQIPSESDREKLKRAHKEEMRREEQKIQKLREEKEAAEKAYQRLKAQASSRGGEFEQELRELRATIRGLEEKLEEPRCFSGESVVLERKRGVIAMKDVEVGNVVATMDGWSPVTTFLHWHRNKVTHAIRISHETGRLIITGRHLVFTVDEAGQQQQVPAETIKPGMTLLLAAVNVIPQTSEVLDVDHITMEGYYAPLTASGTILVDSVVASCYTQEGQYLLPYKLIHYLMAPLRLSLPSWLTYTPAEGELHPYVSFLLSVLYVF